MDASIPTEVLQATLRKHSTVTSNRRPDCPKYSQVAPLWQSGKGGIESQGIVREVVLPWEWRQ